MAYTPVQHLPRPQPRLEEDRRRWAESHLRYRILTGSWERDARERQEGFFHKSVEKFLPKPELSRNPALACTSQISVMYDTEALVRAGDASPEQVELVATDQWSPTMQEVLFLVNGQNECALRLDWDAAEGRARYRVVPAHCIVGDADPARPDRPIRLEELRKRRIDRKKVWTWETWSAEGDGLFKVEVPDEDDPEKPRRDVTALVMAEEIERGTFTLGGPLYADDDGPILPYSLYHRRLASSLWSPYRGRELFDGTLTVSALWTFWLSGVRDGAHPQRYLGNARVHGVSMSEAGQAPGDEFVAGNPMMILMVSSTGDAPIVAGQFQPALDPKATQEALEQFEAGLSVHAGLTPADLTRGTANVSGYSIVVSRDGQRRIQRQLMPPMRAGDRQTMAIGARLANQYGGTQLPTAEKDWTIEYAQVPKTIEEVRAENEEIGTDLEAGITSRVHAYQRRHPGTSDSEALLAVAEVQFLEAFVAELAKDPTRDPAEIKRRIEAGPSTPPPNEPPEEHQDAA